ncbi:MAG: hypothetical protein KAI66_22020 [Lentisphaeria bacterium]|nr:hypothetical protein [Lentisphaeria bacterium]
MKITVGIDLGRDLGQSFGSLFEATSSNGSLVIGAGFGNQYNTRYRGSRHTIQFFVRPTNGERTFTSEALPRPNDLCGTYLQGRDDVVYSTYGGIKAWDSDGKKWQAATGFDNTEEAMRVGDGMLQFGTSRVLFNGKTILEPPAKGSYQRFFYANGHLCFYHVNLNGRRYRLYENDEDGFSKLHACPWAPGAGTVDLSKAVVLTLPVVGETTFAWGQLGKQVLTGSNIGGFYVFEAGAWRMLLKPNIKVSYQLYSTMAYYDRLLMGQYPTGRLFEYDGEKITDLAGWPPRLDGVSGSAREAQSTTIYGGDVFVGVWPWGELWRYNPDSKAWAFMSRMFPHPSLSDKVTHPYDAENHAGTVRNQWGQRVTSLVASEGALFISTSAKWPCKWDAKTAPFLAPDKWKSYGTVHRMVMPGQLSAVTKWTNRPIQIEFVVNGAEITIVQDGKQLAQTTLSGALGESLKTMTKLDKISWGSGIYGPFNGLTIKGSTSGRK